MYYKLAAVVEVFNRAFPYENIISLITFDKTEHALAGIFFFDIHWGTVLLY